jgi:hypothetical protein
MYDLLRLCLSPVLGVYYFIFKYIHIYRFILSSVSTSTVSGVCVQEGVCKGVFECATPLK